MSFKTPLLVDRRVFDKKGKWKSPNDDTYEPFYYYIKTNPTLVASFDSYGREELKQTLTIVIWGEKPLAKEDTLVLENNIEYKVINITLNYFESNVLIKDMLKPRVESMEIELE